MADQISSTAKKLKEKGRKLFRDLIKRPKSANDSDRQSNSTRVAVSSASGAHHGTDVGDAELTASSKHIISFIGGDLTCIQAAMLP
jgi:hypothetical protein